MKHTDGNTIGRRTDGGSVTRGARGAGVYVNHALAGETPWQALQRARRARPGCFVATFVGFSRAA